MSPREDENQFDTNPETPKFDQFNIEVEPSAVESSVQEEDLQIEPDVVLEDPTDLSPRELDLSELIEDAADNSDTTSTPVEPVIIDDADILVEEPAVLDDGPFSSPAREDISQPVRDVFAQRDNGEELSVDATGILRRSLMTPAIDPTDMVDTVDTVDDATMINEVATDTTAVFGAETADATTGAEPAFNLDQQPSKPSMRRVTPQNARFEPTDTVNPDLTLNDTFLEGASIKPTLPSRGPGRLISALVTVLLLPITWYVLADAGARFVVATNNPWQTGQVNLAAIAEMLGGLALAFLIALVALQSALGLLIGGIILTLLGIPFVFIPGWTSSLLQDTVRPALTRAGAVGENLAYHLEFTGSSGLLFMCGVTMIFAAWVLYRVRRIGRKEEGLRLHLTTVNPDGIKAHWARKASAEDKPKK